MNVILICVFDLSNTFTVSVFDTIDKFSIEKHFMLEFLFSKLGMSSKIAKMLHKDYEIFLLGIVLFFQKNRIIENER